MLQQKKEELLAFDNPDVLAERNKLIAERVGKRLEFSNGKIQDLCRKMDALIGNPAPRALLEYLYERIWTTKPGFRREDVQSIIAACHSEAFDRLQAASQDGWY